MTIKKRFLISYIGGIVLACLSLISIICIVLYVTTGTIPSPGKLYRTFTQQRSLSPEEELAYIKLRNIAKTEPNQLISTSGKLNKTITPYETDGLGIVVRKKEKMLYYSKDLVERSLLVHFPKFDVNNIETRGTIDNAGRLYRYMKFDFYFDDQTTGSVMVLKKENNALEFMTKWGILIIIIIAITAVSGVLFLNYLLKKTIIQPLENLGAGMAKISNGELEAQVPTGSKKLAHEVQQLTEDFKRMQKALQHSTDEQKKLENNRKELIASISHDLKTPITSIIGYVEGLLDGVADTQEKQDRYLKTIYTKAVSLNEMIEELFLFSKLDAQAVAFHFEQIQFNQFLKHIIEEFQLQTPSVSIQLIHQGDSEKVVFADRMQLNRVITNLIENSLKFRANNRELRIAITVSEADGLVKITISDNGRGIPVEQLPYVFNHFYRGDEARPTNTGGSGLGLAIVKQIIEKHQGKVWIESQLDQGTTVTILLKKAEGAI